MNISFWCAQVVLAMLALHPSPTFMSIAHSCQHSSAFSLIPVGTMLICLQDMRGKGKGDMVIMVGHSCWCYLKHEYDMSGKIFIFPINMCNQIHCKDYGVLKLECK
jgi:hypothetical protein